MPGKGEPKNPSKEFKMGMLEIEKESNEEFLQRTASQFDEDHVFDMDDDYTMVREVQSDLLHWIEDIESENNEVLAKMDLDFRLNLIENMILSTEGILTTDDELDDEDREMFMEDIKTLKEWKRYLRKWKRSSI